MKKILCAIMSLVMFVACISEEPKSSVQTGGDVSTTPSITLDQTSLSFDEYSDTQLITFYSAMDWTAELINDRADGWCSISPTSGSAGNGEVRVSVNENTTTDDRTASVVIKSGSISRTVRLSQKQRNALTVTTSTFEVESIGGKIYIEVKANVDFEYTINGSAAEWITPIETRAMKTTTLAFNITENNTFNKREGTITIHSGRLSETVTIYQKNSDDAILLSQNEYVVSSTGEDIAVEVTSNVDVEIEMPDVDWITRNVSRATSTNTYYFTIAENATSSQREAYITFKNTAKKLSERVKIIQVQKSALALATNQYNISSEGEQITIELLHNVDFDFEIVGDWISYEETRAMQTDYLVFNIAPNDSYDSREGSIIFTSTDGLFSQTVNIYQAQTDAIVIGRKNIVLTSDSGTFTIELQANVEFYINNPMVNWLRKAEPTRGLLSYSLYYEYDENTTENSRETHIVITDTKNNISETITITQKSAQESENDYVLLGVGYWTDDIIAPLFGLSIETYPVEVYENPAQPGFIFLKDLYTNAYAGVLETVFGIDAETIPVWNTSYFAIDISDPAAVNISGQYTGLDLGYGNMGIWSLEAGTLIDGVISFPQKGLAVQLDDGAYYANRSAMTQLEMPK